MSTHVCTLLHGFFPDLNAPLANVLQTDKPAHEQLALEQAKGGQCCPSGRLMYVEGSSSYSLLCSWT